MNLRSAALLLPLDIEIDPNSNGLPGIGELKQIVGASMTVGLILAVLALIISAIVWALGANSATRTSPAAASSAYSSPSALRLSAAPR